MKKIYRWKFLQKGFESSNGNLKWKIGKWNTVKDGLRMCRVGLHCSKDAYDAFSYVQGKILAKVECRGKHLENKDKECWEEQRVVKAYKWTKKDSVSLAIFSAKLVIGIYEKQYPNDDRPRKAIEAAVRYQKNPTEKNRLAANVTYANNAANAAAYTANAANAANANNAANAAAYAAANAANAAANAAAYAAYTANATTNAATYTAAYTAYVTYAAAYTAYTAHAVANAATIKKIKQFFVKQVKSLKEIKS